MALNLRPLLLAVTLGGVTLAQAETIDFADNKYNTIKSMEIREVSTGALGQDEFRTLYRKEMYPYFPNAYGNINPGTQDKVGKVISVAKDLVALGEDIYRLVIKGKPTNVTSYAPISIIPRVDGENVDILDTENWKTPVKRTFEVVYENLMNMDVVRFKYSIIYSYGGSYQGKGAYLTAVQIVPESVRTLFGYDFTATMKLGGIQNQGTRMNPVAATTLLMEYTVGTVLLANNVVRSYFITGKGGFKKL